MAKEQWHAMRCKHSPVPRRFWQCRTVQDATTVTWSPAGTHITAQLCSAAALDWTMARPEGEQAPALCGHERLGSILTLTSRTDNPITAEEGTVRVCMCVHVCVCLSVSV